jgi:hypothetical protein
MSHYWPFECDRCLLAATNEAQVEACNCTAGSPGYNDKGDGRTCSLHFPPAGLKPNLKTRLKGTPTGVSYLKLLIDALDGRKLFVVGDSISHQTQRFLLSRAKELGISDSFMGDHRFYKNDLGPSKYDHMAGADIAGNLSKWEVWAQHGRLTHLDAARRESEGVVYVYNAGLHISGCGNGDPETNTPCETTYREAVHESLKLLRDIGSISPRRNVPVFIETTIQHFPNLQGDYYFPPLPGNAQLERVSQHLATMRKHVPFYACLPLGCAMGDGTVQQPRIESNGPWNSWRNKIAAEVSDGYPEVFVAPFGLLTAELSDMHTIAHRKHGSGPIPTDCSHWCYSPGFVEATAKLIFEAVRAHDNGIGPGLVAWFSHGDIKAS